MCATNGDILVDIPDEDLPKLAEMYEKHKDWAPHAYSAIKTGIEWNKKSKKRYLVFMSPNNCWKKDGTFFMLLQHYCFDIFIFTLDESGESVYEAVKSTNRLEPTFADRPPLLFCIPNKIYPGVIEAIKTRNMEILAEIPCHSYTISKEDALKFEIECPPDVYIKELDISHASTINELWPHKYKNSENFIALQLTMNGGYGIFLKSDGELVSWINLSMMGQLAQLQTKDAHMKKGYGSVITKYMSKKLAEKGYNPFATALLTNQTSPKMFEKLGFRDLGVSTYTIFRNGKN